MPIRVLIVADDQHLVHDLESKLAHAGCAVVGTVADVSHIPAAIGGAHPDVALIDSALGGGAGATAAAHLVGRPASLPLVVILSHPGEHLPEGVGASVGCITRPFSGPQVIAAIEAALKARNAGIGPSGRAATTGGEVLELGRIFDRLMDSLSALVNCEAAAILLLEDGEVRVAKERGFSQRGGDAGLIDRARFPLDEGGCFHTMLQTGGVVLHPDAQQSGWDLASLGLDWIHSYLGAPIVHEGELYGFISLASAHIDHFTVQQGEGIAALASLAASAISNARLVDQTRRRQRYLTTLHRVSRRAVSSPGRKELLDSITTGLVEELGYAAAAILMIDEPEQQLVISSISSMFDIEKGVGSVLAPLTDIHGRVVRDNAPIVMNDIRQGQNDTPFSGPLPRSELAVPLRRGGTVIGVIAVQSLAQDAFDQLDQDALLDLAEELALYLDNLELSEKARKAAATEERQRLARDLHDAVSQTLFSASVMSEVLPRTYERDPEKVREYLPQLHRLVRGALAEMRMLLMELKPETLEEASLRDLILRLADAAAGRTRQQVQTRVGDITGLPLEVKITIYRVAQEALNTIINYASFTEISVELRLDGEHTILQVTGDGQGFADDDSTLPDRLAVMRERAARIHAALSVTSRPDMGIQVTLKWPA
ncbi:MAG: GAF domain-containing protein [Anaerolineae bacterium]